jgi:tRNA dimethylallyltransferase
MNIGSGKPEKSDLERIRHYLIDIVDPDYDFSAGDFCRNSLDAAEKIRMNGKIPMFVGGTGLYIDSFFKGISKIPEIDGSVRKELLIELEKSGLEDLYRKLKEVDKRFAAGVHPNDKQRILRGLEVFRFTGKTISSFYETVTGYESAKTLYIGIGIERALLRERINARVDQMISRGLIAEVEFLLSMGYGPDLKSMRSIGYAEICQYILGAIDKDEAVNRMKLETSRYAKRQMTWFRRNKKIEWFNPEETGSLRKLLDDWLLESAV